MAFSQNTPKQNLLLGFSFMVDVVILFLISVVVAVGFRFWCCGGLLLFVVDKLLFFLLVLCLSILGWCYCWFDCHLCLACFLKRTFTLGCCCSCLLILLYVVVIVLALDLFVGVLVVGLKQCLLWLCLAPMIQTNMICSFGWFRLEVDIICNTPFKRPHNGMQQNSF